jgi:hypothetical protein
MLSLDYIRVITPRLMRASNTPNVDIYPEPNISGVRATYSTPSQTGLFCADYFLSQDMEWRPVGYG